MCGVGPSAPPDAAEPRQWPRPSPWCASFYNNDNDKCWQKDKTWKFTPLPPFLTPKGWLLLYKRCVSLQELHSRRMYEYRFALCFIKVPFLNNHHLSVQQEGVGHGGQFLFLCGYGDDTLNSLGHTHLHIYVLLYGDGPKCMYISSLTWQLQRKV